MRTLTRKQFTELFHQIQEAWEYSEPIFVYFPSKNIYNLEGIGAMVFSPKRNKVPCNVMIVNSIILTFPINEILDNIYHKWEHIVTNTGEHECEFELFCK